MKPSQRLTLLKIATGAIVGLLLLDRVILAPAIVRWREQGERISALRENVKRGRQLLERERSLRGRWAEMRRTDLSDDLSVAENDVFKGVGRWARESRVNFTSLTPQWRTTEEGRETLECRATATGDQAGLAKFIYEMEVDPLPVHLQECEFTTRDAKGKQLALNVRFSFLRLTDTARPETGRRAR